MKLLLIEDEPAVVSVITRGLSEAGYEVSVAPDGNSGLQMALQNPSFRLIILDVMLPGMNGIEVCRSLRNAQLEVPILMLTALGTTENIVMGLDSGADDYLVKPFKLQELEARIRSLMRRKTNVDIPVPVTPSTAILSLADLDLDTDTKSANRNGKNIQLTATEYRLLEYLLKNPRKVLSRLEILEQVWGIEFNMSTKVVDVYINYLRKKINKHNPAELIHTVVGLGYMIRETKADEDTH
ncbi:response regulator transcription factor [Chitinophaga arvensicola]|uniref:DNA-binding response regulator, OmpR family, contains REC and winged-helix (WHTH) domain n=1 Tax=Chitinophaga arvensicola TaxID=29529 RepID=A0A1I0SAA0_9BACT|nr:response regulator transcription factor [Chitinophaga arvensicola]SEW53292.1 DNA-binding response regulator, OmpR family, contains REC and winged-helix (wHTH) domain [Chitinophaga arvensicola]